MLRDKIMFDADLETSSAIPLFALLNYSQNFQLECTTAPFIQVTRRRCVM